MTQSIFLDLYDFTEHKGKTIYKTPLNKTYIFQSPVSLFLPVKKDSISIISMNFKLTLSKIHFHYKAHQY